MKIARQLLLGAALCYSTFAAADQITLLWASPPYALGSAAGNYSFSLYGGGWTSVAPAEYHGTVTAASPGFDPSTIGDGTGTGIGEDLLTYCYELTQYFYPGHSVVYDVIPGSSGAITAATLDWLGAVNKVVNWSDYNYGWLHPSDRYVAAAIQLGIWETLYDYNNPFNLTSGNFRLSATPGGGVGNYINQFVTAMNDPQTKDLGSQYIVLLTNNYDPYQHRGAQDQITGRLVPSEQRLPEPGSLALVGMAVAVAAIARRRRQRTALAA